MITHATIVIWFQLGILLTFAALLGLVVNVMKEAWVEKKKLSQDDLTLLLMAAGLLVSLVVLFFFIPTRL